MSSLVAKRYVKALVDGREISVVSEIGEQLKLVATAYNDDKFLSIVSSIEIESKQKVDLILSFLENCNDIVKNLIILLGDNRRLNIIPHISDELSKQISVLKNSYVGIVYSNEELSSQYINDMENSFSKKFNVELTLENKVCTYDGIKVDIDGLGVEIGFSQERLKAQMMDYILKAV
ncbi:MAG: F0F1 ATP synthase subunit delta [Arcobacteraceae bacterium]|nr:F0F1 ATP synthase subunit delta [Arcobacteraceae bacterium]